MAQTSKTQVLVIGAGPVGLTMAIELTRHGIPCRIVDKVPPRPITESRALGTHSRTMEIFERLGVLQPMLEQGRILRGFSFYANSKRLGRLTFDGLDAPYPFALILPQSETERILIERLEKLGVIIERPVELTALRQDAEAVYATLRNDDSSEDEVEVSYLIGCDGGRSTVRKILGLDFKGVKMQGTYLVDCQVDWECGSPGDDVYSYLSPRTMLLFGQLPGELWRVVVSMQQDDPRMKSEKPTIELMQSLVDEHPGVSAHLHDMTWASAFYISNRVVDRLRHERVFLAGDAAHIHSPVGGQGMNTGIQDAYNLAWKLALRLSGTGGESLLDSYHAERYPIIKKLLPTTETAEHTLMLRQPLAAELRNDLISLVTSLGFVQSIGRRTLAGFMVNYRNSPIIAEYEQPLWDWLYAVFHKEPHPDVDEHFDFAAGPIAGDRAPDAQGVVVKEGKAKRLFEVWAADTRHQLLVFAGVSAQPQHIENLNRLVEQIKTQYHTFIRPYLVKSPPGKGSDSDMVLLDAAFEMHRRYGAKFECLYLVRPDGYIGFRSQPVELHLLQEFLERVFGVVQSESVELLD